MQNDRYIVCPGSSCAAMVKNYYPGLFHNTVLHNEYKSVQKNFHEFSDFLVNVLHVTDVGAGFEAKACLLDSCSALRECHVTEAPRTLLKKVRGLQLLDMQDADTCCGYGGNFSVKYEEIAIHMAARKLEHVLQTGAEYLVSTDMDCLMHLEGYIRKQNLPVKTIHLADILATGC